MGRVVRLFSEKERRWLFGLVLAYDARANAMDSEGRKGPVHIISCDTKQLSVNLAQSRYECEIVWNVRAHVLLVFSKPSRLSPTICWYSSCLSHSVGRPFTHCHAFCGG